MMKYKESKATEDSGEMAGNGALLQRVAELYHWLDGQIRANSHLAGPCQVCGECCDFDSFDHRLFVTPPELMYLAASLATDTLKPMPTSRCPYNVDGKCSVYEYRFAGCRIFFCKGDGDFQSRLGESALKEFKSICTGLRIAYRYTDLATALNHPGPRIAKQPNR